MELDREEALETTDGVNETGLADARREFGAFVTAVSARYGANTALIAAEYWLEELRSADVEVSERPPMWRNVTIAAASRMARMSALELLSMARRGVPAIAGIAVGTVLSGLRLPSGFSTDVLYAKGARRLAHLLRRLS